MRRGLLLAAAIVLVAAGAIAGINRAVDPENEFYSGAALTKALGSRCLLADDVVRPPLSRVQAGSLPPATRGRASSSRKTSARRRTGPRFVHMGFPGLGPEPVLDEMRVHGGRNAEGREGHRQDRHRRLLVRSTAHPAHVPRDDRARGSATCSAPRTLWSSLGLIRRSRTLAFTGWQREQLGGRCVVDRGTPSPAWRADGTLAGKRAAADATSRPARADSRGAGSRPSIPRSPSRGRTDGAWSGYSGPRRPTPLWDGVRARALRPLRPARLPVAHS